MKQRWSVKLKYKLIGKNNYFDPLETILNNRGIENTKSFLNAGNNPNVENHYSTLKNIKEAVDCIVQHIGGGKRNRIFIQVDP